MQVHLETKDVVTIKTTRQIRADATFATSFTVAGVSIGLQSPSHEQLGRVRDLWQRFFYLGHAAEGSEVVTELSFKDVEEASPEPRGDDIYRTETLQVIKTAQGFFLRCADAWLELNPGENRGEGALPESFWTLNAFEQREFFLLSLLMMLRPHGLYGLHANGLATGGRGLLIVGPSGAGKTTLTLNLLEQGWQFLSDDAVLLKDAEPLYTYAFRRGFSFTPQTESFFDTHTTDAMYRAQDKRVLDIESLYPEQFTTHLKPRLIIFPEISNQPESELSSLSPGEALIALVQQSAGSMIDRSMATKQLELLKRLVQTTSCYRLCAGRDVIEHSSRISAKLQTLLDVADG